MRKRAFRGGLLEYSSQRSEGQIVRQAAASAAPDSESVGRLALRGTLFESAAFGSAQLLRLASNLVLSRLLFPEAFGLTALVSIFLIGLELLSDVGLEPAVVQSPRGDERRFLNTVWTMKIVRGAGLSLMAVALAWPAAALYQEPMLLWLLPVSGLASLLHGVGSTSVFSLRRQLRLGPLAALEILAKSLGVAVMIGWAWISPSVWALVAGGLVEAAVSAIGSHLLPVGYRNRIEWDPEASRAVVHFGKWIFGSSAVFFFGRQGDRLLLGKFLGMSALGIYSIAVMLSEAVGTFVNRITHGVLYPIFSRAAREGQDPLREVYYAARLRMDLLAIPVAGGLAALGQPLVELLYDERYAAAGWMLEILAVRVAMECALAPCETCLFALGQTRWSFLRNVARTLWIWCGIPIGYAWGGVEGLVWATALSEIPVLLVLWPAFRAAGMFRPMRELVPPVAFLLGFALGKALEPFAPALQAWLDV